jgi:hypothetical protein
MITKSRRSDICVFSLDKTSEEAETAAVSAINVHNKTLGVAHVIVLTGPAAFMLTDLVGKEFSVFNRAVRTYRPGFDTDSDNPSRHPLAMADSIARWLENGVEGAEAFESFLVRSAIQQTVLKSDLDRALPPFSEVRRLAASVSLADARQAGASTDELLKLYVEDNSKLLAGGTRSISHHPCRIHSSRSRDDRTRSVYSQSRPRSSATSRM